MNKKLIFALTGLSLAIGLGATPAALTTPAYAVDNMSSTDAPDLTSVRAKLKAKDYAAALTELRDLAEDIQQADVYNLLGFALRKTGDVKTSLTYYTKALELQPDHKAAREYLGELYVETGNMEKAKEQLAALAKLCPGGCEEREDLQKAISAKSRATEATPNRSCSPDEPTGPAFGRSDDKLRDIRVDLSNCTPGYRFAHPGYELKTQYSRATIMNH
jgi:tetratricopeptide (TPR) repeat protein